MIAHTVFSGFRRIYSIPLLLVVWQVSVEFGWISSRLMPAPDIVLTAFWRDLTNGILLNHAAVTMWRALSGFAAGAVFGICLAAIMARYALFARLFEPLIFLGYPIPKIALFPIFMFTFGIGSSSKIAFTFFECFYPVVITTYLGIRAMNVRLIWTARNFGADHLTLFRRVLLPAALPSIFAGLRIALPLAITVVVVTEMIGDSIGLGYYISVWGTRFRFANVYAGILMIGICGLVLDWMLTLLRNRLVKGNS